jgi:hypothetical protein
MPIRRDRLRLVFGAASILMAALVVSPLSGFLTPVAIDYKAQASAYIARGQALGPPAGLDKLIAGNPANGAYGCAIMVGKTDPAEAVRILIRIGQALVVFANTTRQWREGINAADRTKYFRDMYFQQGKTTVDHAKGYLRTLAVTRADLAVGLALDVASFFYSSRARDEAYLSAYVEMARWYLGEARSLAAKAKDQAARKALILQIDNRKRALGL